MKVGVIGLGYVGWPLAELCKEKGMEVFGIDTNKTKIETLKKEAKGIVLTTDYSVLKKCDTVIVCVPTPVDKNKMPDFSCIISSSEAISKNIKKGQLIILESTGNPGMTEEVMQPILEKSGLKASQDFHLAHCPERINPGDKKWNVRNIPRVVGGIDKKSGEKAKEFYEKVIEAPIKLLSDAKTAEAVKIIENSFRDVNIAFVNELAKSFSKVGIDVKEVIEGAATKPFSFIPHYPSCGVGGHCIAVDPYYLIERAERWGFEHKLLKTARDINNSMPHYTVQLLKDALKEEGKDLKKANIGILGVTYKGGVDDIRESPALEVVEELEKEGINLKIYDPYVPKKSNATINEVMKCDAMMLLADHPEFKKIDFSKAKIVIDGKNCLNKELLLKKGVNYKGIGR